MSETKSSYTRRALAFFFAGLLVTAWKFVRSRTQPVSTSEKDRCFQPSPFFYGLVKLSMRWFFGIYNSMVVVGRQHHPETGSYMIVANHLSVLDGIILGVSTPRRISIMVKKEAFSKTVSDWFLRKTYAFPVDRDRPEPTAIKRALNILKDGDVLAIFPEGKRNHNGLVIPFKPGAIRFAIKRKVPIIPAFIANAHRIVPAEAWFPRPYQLKVAFGEALDIKAMLDSGVPEGEILNILYRSVCSLGEKLTGNDVRDLSEQPGVNDSAGLVPAEE